jgi:hypothetical protein
MSKISRVSYHRFREEKRCDSCNEVVGYVEEILPNQKVTCHKCNDILVGGGAIFKAKDYPEVLRVSKEDLLMMVDAAFYQKTSYSIVWIEKKFWEVEDGKIVWHYGPEEEEVSDD